MNAAPLIVRFHGDGLSLTPGETGTLLQELSADSSLEADRYSIGGVIETLETKMAKWLGKERAVFMPTGTLANHLAVRAHCAARGHRVITQADSHLVNDAGDCAQSLSGLNLIPLAPGKGCFTAQDMEAVLVYMKDQKVSTHVGAVSVESPVRRLDNVAVPLAELEAIAALARSSGIGLHLDGARLPLYSAHFGVDPASVAALFDTVYVSLYKCYSAPSGAILAGPAEMLDKIYHARRMFGGGLSAAWPFAAIALYHFESFPEISKQTLAIAEDLFAKLAADGRCQVDRVPNGTNVFFLRLLKGDPVVWRERLLERGIELPDFESARDAGVFVCKMNPSWVRSNADDLAQRLLGCL